MSSQDSRVPIASYSKLRVFCPIFQFELCRVCSIQKRGGAKLLHTGLDWWLKCILAVQFIVGSMSELLRVRCIQGFGEMSSQDSHVPIAGICSRFLTTCLICVGVPRRRGLGKHREEDSGWAG